MLKQAFIDAARERESPWRARIEEVVHGYLASFANDDLEARLALFAEDASFEDPVGTPPMIGHDALRAFYRSVGSLPTRGALRRIAVNTNEAAFVFDITIFGADDEVATVCVIETLELDADGRIKRLRAFWDQNAIS